jgi:hypothetical protein
MKTRYRQWIVGVIFGLGLCMVGAALVHGGRQSNSQYIITKDGMNAGGQTGQSTTYTHTGSLGQSSPLGRSASYLSLNYGGFWGGGMTSPFYTLTVNKSGTGTGTVTGGGINCGPSCSTQTISCEEHTSIVLQAQEEPNSMFDGWLVNGQPVTGEITVTSDLTVTAVFNSTCPWPSPFSYLTPSDGATNQSLDVDLDWEDAAGATSYTVYFGTTSPPAQVTTVSTSAYVPGTLALNTAYYWKIGANNSCGTTEGAEWSFHTTQPPVITSTPPDFHGQGQVYVYDVEATDPDGYPLFFSLSVFPVGMTIDAGTGRIEWSPTTAQIGLHSVEVKVEDGLGGEAIQSFNIEVTDETFYFMSVPFHEGVNPEQGVRERDPTVMTLTPGTMQHVKEILLPNVPNLFTFSDTVNFHFEYRQVGDDSIVFVPESSIALMTLVDTSIGGESYEDIHTDDLAGFTFTAPVSTHVNGNITVVFQRSDGRSFKIGNFVENHPQWAVELNYAELL